MKFQPFLFIILLSSGLSASISNSILGKYNQVSGSYNAINGIDNSVHGNANGVFGNSNDVMGSANLIGTLHSSINTDPNIHPL